MYRDREARVEKVLQLRHVELYPEALIIAREMAELWPDHPSGWSHMTEIYGYYFGNGFEASRAVQRGLRCSSVQKTDYWEALTVQSMLFASNPTQLAEGINGILQHFPKTPLAHAALQMRSTCNGNYTFHDLAGYHFGAGQFHFKEKELGAAASHWALACAALLDIKDEADFLGAFNNLISVLDDINRQMESHRKSLGLGFAPEDRLSLKFRDELFSTYVNKYFPADPVMYNRWAATLSGLEDYVRFESVIGKALTLKRFDKPLINKAGVLRILGTKAHYAGNLDEAFSKYKEAKECLDEALSLGGDEFSQSMAIKDRAEIEYLLQIADRIIYPRENLREHSEGIERYNVLQREEMPMMKGAPGFTPARAAISASERLNLNDYKQTHQCTVELLEDMNPPFGFAIITEFKTHGRTFELFFKALADIAGDESKKYGAMQRDAQETLAILVLKANGAENIHATFAILYAMFPQFSSAILKSTGITFGTLLQASLEGHAKTERQTGQSDDDVVWWSTEENRGGASEKKGIFQFVKNVFKKDKHV